MSEKNNAIDGAPSETFRSHLKWPIFSDIDGATLETPDGSAAESSDGSSPASPEKRGRQVAQTWEPLEIEKPMDLESEKPYQFAKSGCSCWVDCTQHSKSVLRCLFRQIHVILGLRSDGRQVHPGVKGTGSSWYSNVFPPLLGKHPAHPGGNMLSPFIKFLVTLQLCTRTPADGARSVGKAFLSHFGFIFPRYQRPKAAHPHVLLLCNSHQLQHQFHLLGYQLRDAKHIGHVRR